MCELLHLKWRLYSVKDVKDASVKDAITKKIMIMYCFYIYKSISTLNRDVR